jgi:hypothetical protein
MLHADQSICAAAALRFTVDVVLRANMLALAQAM